MSNLLFETRFVDAKTIIFFGIALFIACGNTSLDRPSNAQATPRLVQTPVERDKGDDLVVRLSDLYDAKNCVGFFNAFPSTFSEFEQLYGFSDQLGEQPLYRKYEGHLQYFLHCPEISSRARLEKLIGIGVGGRWDADATAMIQDASYDLIKESPTEACEILNGLPDSQASSFWYFVLDGPHPKDRATIERMNVLKNALGNETKQLRLLTVQYQELIRNPPSH